MTCSHDPIKDDRKDDLETPTPRVTRSAYVLMMTPNSIAQCCCYVDTCKVMSNSSDIDIILSDIQEISRVMDTSKSSLTNVHSLGEHTKSAAITKGWDK